MVSYIPCFESTVVGGPALMLRLIDVANDVTQSAKSMTNTRKIHSETEERCPANVTLTMTYLEFIWPRFTNSDGNGRDRSLWLQPAILAAQ